MISVEIIVLLKWVKKTAMKTLAADIAYSEAVTRIGYDKAEKKYNENKKD